MQNSEKVGRFLSTIFSSLFADGVRLREERRREPAAPNAQQQQQLLPPQQQQQPRSFTSRRSSTDSSEEGFNLNVRDLKVQNFHSLSFLNLLCGI